ncbi:chew-like family protein [Heliomicrobium modesticaldum Ice1]|uniref:Chew-like family protein n=1 Tax=Heliobacterium modesticaldum (strain ATCC 51547 / Ice1) TaxID=498761 RepID=B0TG85_HELMI|nr:chemotaxis protein CheW [Heliomicrobium modesticaldum]ABZ84581.1 chew-like family protein [Heliomicrobium modesticaldum Ice1]
MRGNEKAPVAYMILPHRGQRYALPAVAVRQISDLPYLQPAKEYPPPVAGLLRWRDQVIPVLALDRCLGRRDRPMSLTDRLVILEAEGKHFGLVVEDCCEMREFSDDLFDLPVTFRGASPFPSYMKQAFSDQEGLCFVIDLSRLLAEAVDEANRLEADQVPDDGAAADRPWTAEERRILLTRARALRQGEEKSDEEGTRTGAVVVIGQERFWIDIDLVREFASADPLIPIPCTPPFVAGVSKLRGQLITVFDLRPLLGATKEGTSREAGRLVVIEAEGVLVGLLVEEVIDVVSIRPEKIRLSPLALQTIPEEYAGGEVQYREKERATILDVARILNEGDLVIQEEV